MKSLVVRSCARCGGDHDNVQWEQLQRPIVDDDGTAWTHWAPCPTNGQPILQRHTLDLDALANVVGHLDP